MLPSKRKLPVGLAIAAQSAEFWRRMAPELTISDAQPRGAISRQSDLANKEKMALVNEGFLHLEQPGFDADFALLATVVKRIVTAGLPPAFIGVYDETWALAGQLSEVMNVLFGGKAMMVPNFSASFGANGEQGVPAHRRRPRQGVFADGRPKSASVWVPLTRATARNGCVYAVPANQDRNYGKPDPARADSSLLAIRALPADPGDVLIWTGETYHWQAHATRHHDDGPLTSLTWEFQSRDIGPLEGLLVDSYPYVPFETRLGILARQMPQHTAELSGNPVWRALGLTLANRYPLKTGGLRA